MAMLQTFALFVLTALAEIIGCYLPYLWLRRGHYIWLLAPAAVSLALFAWLLTLHPTASGRVYAAYGGCTSAWRCCGCGRSMACGPASAIMSAWGCAWPACW